MEHVGDDVGVARVVLHGRGLALHVHGGPRHAELGGHQAVGGTDVVEQGGSGGDGGSGHGRLPRVDRHLSPRVGQALHHRHDAAQLLGLLDGGGSRSGGFTAHIEPIGALDEQLEAVRDGRVGVGEATSVGERVRGDVDDAHHERPFEHVGILGPRFRSCSGWSRPFRAVSVHPRVVGLVSPGP